jgi:nucleolar protein 56
LEQLLTWCSLGWHFPELAKIVNSNEQYAKVVLQIGDKSRLSDEDLHELAAVVDDDESIAQAIINAARTSMGRDLSAADMEIVMAFAKRTASLAAYRKQLSNYLGSRMNQVAPNLAALIGDTVGARLISKAGSLTNLSKYPASTVQILGAEKALFRALKTKGNTPKVLSTTVRSSAALARSQREESRVSLPTSAPLPPGLTTSPTHQHRSSVRPSSVRSTSALSSTHLVLLLRRTRRSCRLP